MADPFADIPVATTTADPFADIPVAKKEKSSTKEELASYAKAKLGQEKEFYKGMVSPILGMLETIPYKPFQEKVAADVRRIKPEEEKKPTTAGELAAQTVIPPRFAGQATTEMGLAYLPGKKILDVAKGMRAIPRALTEIGGGSALSGLQAYLTTTSENPENIAKEKQKSATISTAFGAPLSALPAAGRAGKEIYNKVKTAYGKGGEKAAEELAGELTSKTKPVVEAAKSAVEESEKEVERVGKAQVQLGGRDPIAASRQAKRETEVTTSLDGLSQTKALPDEDVANVILKSGKGLKGTLDTAREAASITENKNPMFTDARTRYAKGDRIENNPESKQAFAELIQTVDAEIEKLPINERAGLEKFRRGLLGEKGELTEEQQWANKLLQSNGKPPAFQVPREPLSVDQAEYYRRMFNDKDWRAKEGFATLSGKQLGSISEKLQNAVNQYDKRYGQYISEYAKGKQAEEAAFGASEKFLEEIGGKSANKLQSVSNYFLDGKKDSAERMVSFVGGKTPELVNAIKADFRTKMEGMSSKEMQSFIKKNQGLLEVFPELKDPMNKVALAKSVAEKAPIEAEKRAVAAGTRLTGEKSLAEATKRKAEQTINKYNADLLRVTDRPVEETKKLSRGLLNDLLKDKVITETEFRLYDKKLSDIVEKYGDSAEAKQQIRNLGMAAVRAAIPAGVAGSLYYGYKALQ